MKYEYTLTTNANEYDYRVEVVTNNYECYQQLREGISAVIAEYEDEQEDKTEETSNAD